MASSPPYPCRALRSLLTTGLQMILGMSFSPPSLPEIIERLSVAFAEGMKGREERRNEGRRKRRKEEGGQRFYGEEGRREGGREEGRSGDNNDVLRDGGGAQWRDWVGGEKRGK